MSLQHVALTSHSLCKGGKTSCATRCSSILCVLENLNENLSPQQLLPQQFAQIESDFLRLVAATKFCCRKKIFIKVLQYTRSAGRCRLDLLCKLVAQCFPYPLVVLIKRIRELALTNSSCQYVICELLSTCKFNHILLSQFEHGTDLAVI